MRERTAAYVISSGKSATSVAEEMGIDTKWMPKQIELDGFQYTYPRWIWKTLRSVNGNKTICKVEIANVIYYVSHKYMRQPILFCEIVIRNGSRLRICCLRRFNIKILKRNNNITF